MEMPCLLLPIIPMAMFIIFLIWFLVTLPRAMAVKRAVAADIGALRPGFFAIHGRVIPMEVMKSRISRKFCVYCHYEIQYYQNGKNAGWRTEKNVIRYKKFLLADGSGAVVVNPERAKVDKPSKIAASKMKKRFLELCRETGVQTTSFFGFDRTLRCLEKRISPDDELTIFGTVRKDPHLPTPDGLVIEEGSFGSLFLISLKPIEQIKKKTELTSRVVMILTFVFLFIAVALGIYEWAAWY